MSHCLTQIHELHVLMLLVEEVSKEWKPMEAIYFDIHQGATILIVPQDLSTVSTSIIHSCGVPKFEPELVMYCCR